jgi:hypothetical protein
VAETLGKERDLWPIYGTWLATFFPDLWEEIEKMAKQKVRGPVLDLRPVIEKMGVHPVNASVELEKSGHASHS